MSQRVLVSCALLLMFSAFSSAQAGVPIPCTGSHFLKGSDVPGAKDARGQGIALYYNVSGCSGGRWDGYRSADGKYHKLTPNVLSSLPPAPGFWSSAWQNKGKFWVEWLWILVGAFVVIGTLLTKLSGLDAANGFSPGGRPPTVRSG